MTLIALYIVNIMKMYFIVYHCPDELRPAVFRLSYEVEDVNLSLRVDHVQYTAGGDVQATQTGTVTGTGRANILSE